LDVIYYGNATNRDQSKSVIYYNPILNTDPNHPDLPPTETIPPAVDEIKAILNAPAIKGIPEEYLNTDKRSPAQVVIEIGADYKSITKEDPFSKLLYLESPKEETSTTSTEKPLNSSDTSTTAKTNTSTNSTGTSSTTTSSKTVTKPTNP
jgi:hypothetical protein